jgi:hypothetical protein
MYTPMDVPVAEHWTQWIARKTYKSVFSRRKNKSSYEPKTNTPGLLDGSAEARQILRDAQVAVFDSTPSNDGIIAMGILRDALDHVKGKDLSPSRFKFSAEFFTDLVTWVKEQQGELVQIEPTSGS